MTEELPKGCENCKFNKDCEYLNRNTWMECGLRRGNLPKYQANNFIRIRRRQIIEENKT